MSLPTTVVDETGTVHRLVSEPIGRGGQGVVFRTRSPDVAVKLILGGAPRPRSHGERATAHLSAILASGAFDALAGDAALAPLRERLDDVRLLPLDDLQIARPIALLRGHVGYAMRLLTDMEPVAKLIAPPSAEGIAEFYVATGGLRRRLRTLARTARLLSRLHGIPAVYGDVSPNNVFVSSDHDHHEAWLIDPDNLHLEGERGPAVYTPGYGAPEVLQRRARPSTLSDAWSFAVLAFQVLAQAHPLIGARVEEGGWDESVDLEAKAFAGELPWIHDDQDDDNHGELGIFPRDLVLSPRISALFARALGRGRLQPAARPSLAEWADVLEHAADHTLRCPSCASTYYLNRAGCPWCDAAAPPSFVFVRVRRWHPDIDEELLPTGVTVASAVLDGADARWTLPTRILRPTLARDRDEPGLALERTSRGLVITPMAGGPYLLVGVTSASQQEIDKATKVDLPEAGREWHLHCGPLDANHRVASFGWVGVRPR